MKKLSTAAIFIATFAMGFTSQAEETSPEPAAGKHLFILSGQSNMARLHPKKRFAPHVEKAFGKDSVIVVDDSHSGAPIRPWYDVSKPVQDNKDEAPKTGPNFDQLMEKVQVAIKDQNVATVTFIWMQGESDAMGKGKVADYEANLKGLIGAIKKDLGRDAMNIVIGRISDYGLFKDITHQRAWTQMREIQMEIAKETPNCEWIDTDDLNDAEFKGEMRSHLHYTHEGYNTLGQRFAEKAIEMIKKK